MLYIIQQRYLVFSYKNIERLFFLLKLVYGRCMTCQFICAYTFSIFRPFFSPQSCEAKCQVLCRQPLSIVFLFIPMSTINVLMAGAYQCNIWQSPVSALSPIPPGNEKLYSQDKNRPHIRQKLLLISKYMTSQHQNISSKN